VLELARLDAAEKRLINRTHDQEVDHCRIHLVVISATAFARSSEPPDPDRGFVGHRIVAIHPRALDYAVDELLGVDGSRTMKIGSGEHLAAILLTALVGAPETIDRDGGVDLTFLRAPEHRGWKFGDHSWVAVEAKSFPGPYRKVDRHIQAGKSSLPKFEQPLTSLRTRQKSG
jgi:hypothetical protein